ncbi:MAG: response regulator transcription factor [Bacilli bacterium]|nr:response regulator transcription factor [Bacilli bacterium]
MIKVAILDDEDIEIETISSYLGRYGKEKDEVFQISVFKNAVSFLEDYKADYQLVFMDICMPYINGIDAAKILREKDENVPLIFVTSLAQYAVDSYKVEASDYLLKPLSYIDFNLSLTRVLRKITKDDSIVISYKNEFQKLRISDIIYVETATNHRIIYHTKKGDFTRFASLKKAEDELNNKGFACCNQCYLVNLNFVANVEGYVCTLNDGTQLQISQPKKKSFFATFNMRYLS